MIEIDEITRFLAKFAPEKLEALRGRHPTLGPYFEPGELTLGEPPDDAGIDAALTMLLAVEPVADQALLEVRKSLGNARNLELVGGLTALVASGGVVANAAVGSPPPWSAILGVVGVVASGLPLIVGWMRGLDVGGGTKAERFLELRDKTWTARELAAELRRPRAARQDGATDAALAERANGLAKELTFLLSDLGYPVIFGPVSSSPA